MTNWFALVQCLILAILAAVPTASHLAAAEKTLLLNNVVPLTVRMPHGGFNRMVVSVTVCEPGTDRCARIDDVMVDTGSTGLRLEASAVPRSLHLPALLGSDGEPLAECVRFVHDTAWGGLHRASFHIGGMTAPDLAIQVIGDDARPQPAACPVSDVQPTSNGTLGIGPWLLDCPGDCEQDERYPGVFAERAGTWSPLRGPLAPAYRLPNPVAAFHDHGNGVVFDLPIPPHNGAAQVVGTLTFGVGTARNNQLDGARILGVDDRGRFTTLYGGQAYPDSIIDSGTETYLLPSGALPRCEGMSSAFCAKPDRTLAATMVGRRGTQLDVAFKVGDTEGALDRHIGAWDGFAESSDTAQSFVWGAPFFFGRRVTVVFDGRRVPGMQDAVGPAYGIR